jgi:two-component system, HptB-dependent secretion and biofilm response regulator
MNTGSLAFDHKNNDEIDTLIKVLVVEDQKLDQFLLREILLENGYDVLLTSTGKEAIDVFNTYKPDVVYMDVNLPDINGYLVTDEIKKISNREYVPVIFITGSYEGEIIEKCFDSGGDDFVVKPIKEKLLMAKTKSLLRIRKMHNDLLTEKEDITNHSEEQLKDLHDADAVIHNIHKPRFYDSGNLNWSYIAQNILSGDIVCSAIGPSGNQIVLVGDNTGHGLPAAIGSIITCETFYSMANKGFDIKIIVEEINKKLCQLLPTDRFLSACIMEFDIEYKLLKIWNAGMPDILIFDKAKQLKQSISSMHLPLGIIHFNEKDVYPVSVNLKEGDRIYAYSDGLTEVFNNTGEIYGEERLVKTIQYNFDSDKRVDEIIYNARTFNINRNLTDDVLLLEIDCDKSRIKNREKKKVISNQIEPMYWNVDFNFETEVIAKSNPVPIIIQALVDMQGFNGHREKIFLILTEMYSNALEHGILELDSSIKEQQNGFNEYYVLRQQKLDKLTEGKILLSVKNFIENGNGVISIAIEDTGKGFDYSKVISELDSNVSNSGRGIALLQNLCRKCEFSHGGRKLNIEYEWQQENMKNVA